MRRSPLFLVLLLAACSSGSPKALVGASPSPEGASPSPAAAATSAAASPAATRARVTASPTPSPAARTSSPAAKPRKTQSRLPSPSPKPSATRKGSTYGVDEVAGDRFSPSRLTLRVGDYVLVTDKDSFAPHTFTIEALHVDSGGMNQGDTFRYRFLKAGTFDFICTYHENVGMTGRVTVKP
jgi:plastocyanin